VELLSQDRAVVYHSTRETERAARLARLRWGELATAFAATPAVRAGEQPRAIFTVKAAFSQPHEPDEREHMWLRVQEFKGDSAVGELVNQPLQLKHIKQGDIVTIRRDDVSDWQVFTPAGAFAPTDVPALWRTLDVLKNPAQSDLPPRRRSIRGIPRAIAEAEST
jgi:uncharacterized protein YegJ (DUF2314 family)